MDPEEDDRLTPNDVLLYFKIFLKSWIQIILAERNVYPITSFEDKNAFNLIVPWTRHPSLDEWLDGLIETIVDDLQELSCVCLTIHNDATVKERYVLDLSELRHLKNILLNDRKIEGTNELDTFNELRGCLYSLIQKIRTLEKPKDIMKFSLVCETVGDLNNKWVRDDTDDDEGKNKKSAKQVISLKPVEANEITMYSNIEVYE